MKHKFVELSVEICGNLGFPALGYCSTETYQQQKLTEESCKIHILPYGPEGDMELP